MGWFEQLVYDTGFSEGFVIGGVAGIAVGVSVVFLVQWIL